MGLRRVLFLSKILFVSVEVPGFFVWPGSYWPRGQVLRSVASRLEESRFRDRSGWRPPHGRPPLFGSLGLTPSGTGPKHHLSARCYVMSNRHRPHDPLRQPRWLPDLYAVVARDERGQLPAHRGQNTQLTHPILLNREPFLKQSTGRPLIFLLRHSLHLKSTAPKLRTHVIRVFRSLRHHSAHLDPHPDGSQSILAQREGGGLGQGRRSTRFAEGILGRLLGEGETDRAATPRLSSSARGSRGLPSCRRRASPRS
jgi:hypothetical protein